MANLTIRDAFKALEDVQDVIEVQPKAKERKVVNEGWQLKGSPESRAETQKRLKHLKDLYDMEPGDLTPSEIKELKKAGMIEESCELKEEPVYDMSPRYDAQKSFYGKAKVDVKDNGVQVCKSYGTPVALIKDGKAYLLSGVTNYYSYRTSSTTLRHVKEFLKQNGFKAESLKQIEKDYPVISDSNEYEKMIREGCDKSVKESVEVDLNKKEDIEKGKEELVKSEERADNVEQIVDVDAETVDELKDSYIGNVILQCPVCRTLIYKKPKALKKSEKDEGIYNVEDECPHCGAKEGYELVGQVASLEVKPDESEDTTGTEVETEPAKEEPVEDDKEANVSVKDEESEKEFEFEGLDEKRFNRLVNKYINSIYENVDKFEATSGEVDDDNNRVVVEGKITYKSGKTLDTKFVFEALSMTKAGKVKFKGLNETFTKAKKPFTLIASVRGKSLVCEQLNYNYNVKVSNETRKVKGKVLVQDKKTVR